MISDYVLANEEQRWANNHTYQVLAVSLISMPFDTYLVTTVLVGRTRRVNAVETSLYRNLPNLGMIRERALTEVTDFNPPTRDEVI